MTSSLKGTILIFACSATMPTARAAAQFDDIPIPPAMATLEFMVGTWSAEGSFRTPDHIHPDRTLWYLTRGGGVTRFDGQTWTAFVAGESLVADSVLTLTTTRAAPFAFSNRRGARWIQDGFALFIDEGRTSGSTLIYFDTNQSALIATAFHAPTNGTTTAVAQADEDVPVFEGRATDRRGERLFRRRYERHNADHFTIHTDVSFDGGTTWIDDQIRQEVRRRSP